MVDVNECKRFCGVVDPEEDAVIGLCMDAAQEYIRASGVPEHAQKSSQYKLCVYMLAGYFYDNRSQIGEGAAARVSPGVVNCIAHLKSTPREKEA